jgi:hypothetical protein
MLSYNYNYSHISLIHTTNIQQINGYTKFIKFLLLQIYENKWNNS